MRGQGLDTGYFEPQRVEDFPLAREAQSGNGEARLYEPVLSEWFNYSNMKSLAAALRQRTPRT